MLDTLSDSIAIVALTGVPILGLSVRSLYDPVLATVANESNLDFIS